MSAELTPQEQDEIVVRHWYEEALAFKAAGIILKTVLDSEQRSQAINGRIIHLERCDALLDVHLELIHE